jgi:predicted PurR-regulated permease PerM
LAGEVERPEQTGSAAPREGGVAGWLRSRSPSAGPDRPGRTERLLRVAALVWILVGAAVLTWMTWRLLWPIVVVVAPPLLVAGLIVYALDPSVAALARRRLPRWLATAVVYVGVVVTLGGMIAAAAPLVASQVGALADEAPDLRGQGKELLEQGFGAIGLELQLREDADGGEIAREVRDEAEAAIADEATRQRLTAALGGLAGAAAGTAQLLLLLLLGPVVAFYLLADLPRVKRTASLMIPPRRRTELVELAAAVGRVAGGYVRGQLIVALIVGVLTTAGFAFIGLPFWAVVGLAAGVSNLVPFVGPLVGGLLGVAIALLTDGIGLVIGVVVVVVVVQQLESQVLQPLVMGRTVEIPPVLVLLAVVVGGALFGLPGLLLAVPAVASAKVIGAYLWHRHVPWAEGGPPPPPEAVDGALVAPVRARR